MANNTNLSKDEIERFCRENDIKSLAFFGSVLRDDFKADSDVDVMVEFKAGKEPGLFELIEIQQKLSEIIGHKVDLVERRAIEKSENYIRRRHILKSLEMIYVAR